MPPAKPVNPQSACPCGSEKPLISCCLPYIRNIGSAPTAESLMRSRYSAHVLAEIDYLWNTWAPEQRIHSSKEAIYQWATSCEWLGLQILATKGGGEKDDEGIVNFIATFRAQGTLAQHQEISLFRRELGRWLYIDHQE